MTRYSTKTEIADELGHERSAVAPLVDEAFKRCCLDEDPPYKCFWALNDDAGRERLARRSDLQCVVVARWAWRGSTGFMKRMMEEEWERGWSSADDKWVCPDHVEDYALEQLIRETATSTACSYCSREARKPIAAELDVLIERIAIGLKHEWRDADDEGVPWEGGYVGKTYDSYDVLTDAVDSPLNDGDLIADVANALTATAWAQRDFFRLVPPLRLQFAWGPSGRS